MHHHFCQRSVNMPAKLSLFAGRLGSLSSIDVIYSRLQIDMLTQGDTIYDVIDRRDHATWRVQLQQRSPTTIDMHGTVDGANYSPMSSVPADCCHFYSDTLHSLSGGRSSNSARSVMCPSTSGSDCCPGDDRSFYCRMFVARTCRRSAASGCSNHKVGWWTT